MIDYAESITAKEYTKEKSRVFFLSIPMPRVFFALFFAFLIYTLGYQNSTIAQVGHDINMKKNRLAELQVVVDNLKLQKARMFSSKEIIKNGSLDGLCIADSNKIQIVH